MTLSKHEGAATKPARIFMDRVLRGVESKTSAARISRRESSNQRTAANQLPDKLLQKRTPRLKELCSFS
jgi:hypothetical protein